MRSDLPSGTVTFLFTDVEGSTKLLHSLGADAYAKALAEHRRVIREACGTEGGVEVDTQGDAFFFAFQTAPGALTAAAALTDALAPGPIHVRVGLHTGTPLVTDEGYVGDDVHLAARVGASAHGGQVVVSEATRALVDGVSLTDLGEHRLKDIERAVSIYQVGAKTFPPLKTISNTNLPRPASSFVGRERELSEVLASFERGTRLLTLTGPGGSGKTRLAVEAAATLVPSYKAGVFWVGLASLRDPSLVTEQIAQTLGAKDDLAEHIGEREMLLLLDNLEQVIDAAPALSGLVQACPNLTLFCTSRELLRVQGEVEYAVPPLASSEAVSLFCERSGLEPSDEITDLCAQLDDLPLAVELAAARTKALSPTQILQRLSDRLDLLRGGRDADARQQTLRATIAWSYDLLSEEEQRVFRALSVFAGGCTLHAAEEICEADLGTLQSLVEKSLLRFANERFWLLVTIREYAREQLVEGGEIAGYALRHSRWYLGRLKEHYLAIRGSRRAESLAWFDSEEDNLRVMLDELIADAIVDAAEAAALLHRFWVPRNAYFEPRQRFAEVLARDGIPDQLRARLLLCLGTIESRVGDNQAVEAAAREILAVAEPGSYENAYAFLLLAEVAMDRGEIEEAVDRGVQALAAAEQIDDQAKADLLSDVGEIFGEAGRTEEARSLAHRTREVSLQSWDELRAAISEFVLGRYDLYEHKFGSACATLTAALSTIRGHDIYEAETLRYLGFALLGLGRRADARASFLEALELEIATSDSTAVPEAITEALGGIALASDPADENDAARLRGAVDDLRQSSKVARLPRLKELEHHFEQPLIDALGKEVWDLERAAGAKMTLDETIELARSLADT